MSTEGAKLGRIQAVICACEEFLSESKTKDDKINAAIVAYEHIVKILKENENVDSKR